MYKKILEKLLQAVRQNDIKQIKILMLSSDVTGDVLCKACHKDHQAVFDLFYSVSDPQKALKLMNTQNKKMFRSIIF